MNIFGRIASDIPFNRWFFWCIVPKLRPELNLDAIYPKKVDYPILSILVISNPCGIYAMFLWHF